MTDTSDRALITQPLPVQCPLCGRGVAAIIEQIENAARSHMIYSFSDHPIVVLTQRFYRWSTHYTVPLSLMDRVLQVLPTGPSLKLRIDGKLSVFSMKGGSGIVDVHNYDLVLEQFNLLIIEHRVASIVYNSGYPWDIPGDER